MNVKKERVDGMALEVARIASAIKPLLAERGPEIQSAVLADLMAMLLAGHPDFVRDDILDRIVGLVRKLVPLNEGLLFGPDGHPQNRGKPH